MYNGISRGSDKVTAKKCTKKCDARAKFFFAYKSYAAFSDISVAVAVVGTQAPYDEGKRAYKRKLYL